MGYGPAGVVPGAADAGAGVGMAHGHGHGHGFNAMNVVSVPMGMGMGVGAVGVPVPMMQVQPMQMQVPQPPPPPPSPHHLHMPTAHSMTLRGASASHAHAHAHGPTTTSVYVTKSGMGAGPPSRTTSSAGMGARSGDAGCSMLLILLGLIILAVVFAMYQTVIGLEDLGSVSSSGASAARRWRAGTRAANPSESHLQQLLDAERMLRAAAEERAERLSNELLEVNRKHRDLEAEFRDLALTARAQSMQQQQQQQQNALNNGEGGNQADVSTLARLAKCRSSVEASTETIKELRRLNEDMHTQVERLQKELKEAVADVDATERELNACNARVADLERPPPPPPPS